MCRRLRPNYTHHLFRGPPRRRVPLDSITSCDCADDDNDDYDNDEDDDNYDDDVDSDTQRWL